MLKKNKMVYEFEMPKNGVCCIYRLISESLGIVYIGQSERLKERIKQHISLGREFDYFEYFECDKSIATDIECEEIVKHNPCLNTQLPKTDKYIALGNFKKELIRVLTEKVDSISRTVPLSFDRDCNGSTRYKYVSYKVLNELLSSIEKIDKNTKEV